MIICDVSVCLLSKDPVYKMILHVIVCEIYNKRI